ncbi:hypothetical protein Glove_521g19 [Diversispora epigaea]|uniref:Uncharacterized protein n=1 Tax=Diversispora epigaea TaxID=1348612 RepID=A0A397GEK4_9GLOM|nr:hypothetical protein Glove_521g19 [Diversispora epigaea]
MNPKLVVFFCVSFTIALFAEAIIWERDAEAIIWERDAEAIIWERDAEAEANPKPYYYYKRNAEAEANPNPYYYYKRLVRPIGDRIVEELRDELKNIISKDNIGNN